MLRLPGFASSCFVFTLLLTPVCAIADTDETGRAALSLDDIAKELHNPAGSLSYIANDFEYRTYQGKLPGAGEQSSEVYVFRPAVGIPLANGRNLLFRAAMPIHLSQPKYVADREYYDFLIRQWADTIPTDGYFESGHSFRGDTLVDFAYGGVSENNWITMYGIAGVLGTSTDSSAARNQYLWGPEVAVGKVTDWGIIGAWLSHVVDVWGGSTADIDSEISSVKIFFSYGLGNGWQIFSNPTISYDWEATSDNKLLLPLGAGISKTTSIGRMPLNLSLDIQNYVVSPDAYGPEWLLTFSVTPIFPNLFRR